MNSETPLFGDKSEFFFPGFELDCCCEKENAFENSSLKTADFGMDKTCANYLINEIRNEFGDDSDFANFTKYKSDYGCCSLEELSPSLPSMSPPTPRLADMPEEVEFCDQVRHEDFRKPEFTNHKYVRQELSPFNIHQKEISPFSVYHKEISPFEIKPHLKNCHTRIDRPKRERRLCAECKDLLGIEVVHPLATTPKTHIEWKFEEIQEKFSVRSHVVHDWNAFKGPVDGVLDLYKFVDTVINMMTNFINVIDGSCDLSVLDHRVLIKSGVQELIKLYSIMTASQDGVFWNLRDAYNNIRVIPTSWLLQLGTANYENHLSLTRSFPLRWRWDKKFMALLFAIIYYNPDRGGLLEKDKVWKVQNVFYNYLRHYFQTIYGPDNVQMAFMMMVSFMAKLRVSATKVGQTLFENDSAMKSAPLATTILSSEDIG